MASPLVWVTQGKTQHPAHLLEDGGTGEALVRWESTKTTEWVSTDQIAQNLLPRRRRKRQTPSGNNATKASGGVVEKITLKKIPLEKEITEDDDEVEILLTINPPTPKRNRASSNAAAQESGESSSSPLANLNESFRSCRRRLLVDTSADMLQPMEDCESDDDGVSIDTQEDMVLADLVTPTNNAIDDSYELQVREVEIEHISHSQLPNNVDLAAVETEELSSVLPAQPEARLEETARLLPPIACPHKPPSVDPATILIEQSSSTMESQAENSAPVASSSEPPTVATDDSSKAAPPDPMYYTYQSSAYVQNLAEICYTVMNDQRWRVGGCTNKPLFAWEYGDDLSAIQTLAPLYDNRPQRHQARTKCVCLLCRQTKTPSDDMEEDNEGMSGSEPEPTTTEEDQDDSRALNLYCRMFYRKGPWFRLDDIFTRYYSPKRKQSPIANTSDSQIGGGQTPSGGEQTLIDEAVFQEALAKMKDMLDDMNHLCARGLLRTFSGEEECGKMTGSVSPEGGGVILNADERRAVLAKLGGSKKKTSGRWNKSDGERKSISPRDNEIWKQMCQQQSITAGMFVSKGSKKKERHVLPVRHHVNHEVLSKLASAVVLSASLVEYVPAGVLRSKLIEVKKVLSSLTQQRGSQALNFAKFDTAFRLREPPLLALRRCCRLYLCATCGPGDMRGDGTNGWKSTMPSPTEKISLPLARSLARPGDNAWHSTTYPGLASRFGLTHYGFVDAYEELPVSEESSQDNAIVTMQQVFANVDAFRLWELAVEIRANTDYVVELNDLILYDERRKARDAENEENALPRQGNKQSFLLSSSDQGEEMSRMHVDFLHLLDKSVRKTMIFKFCSFTGQGAEGAEHVVTATEASISAMFSTSISETDEEELDDGDPMFRTDCQKVIFVIAIIATNVLKWAYEHMPDEERKVKSIRCWLRHMWGEGVLAYVLWDCIPILEKLGLHGFAARALEVLVFGSFQPETWKQGLQERAISNAEWGISLDSTPIGDIMISRRARGKAIERLMIDYIHILRKELKDKEAALESVQVVPEKKTKEKKTKKKKAAPKSPRAADMVNTLCGRILTIATCSGFISFAAMRAIARRTKQPLSCVVEAGGGKEAQELGLRLCNGSESDNAQQQKGYIDWAPKTDEAVAVALAGPDNGAGGRCSYFGFEDDNEEDLAPTRALNVEELAMEYYATGRLPVGDANLAGGSWVGWHDEGGHLRTLFRILCAFPILGMDGGCGSQETHGSPSEAATIHLSKYQGAPFDLHVGSWSSTKKDGTGQSVSGFYHRRRKRIDEYLKQLEKSTPQELADCVHDAIQARVASVHKTRTPNVALTRDIKQLRILSMLAAGFGGKHLSAAFRCMLFDYRHYSGGLPDLLLARALYCDPATEAKEFVDLGEWVGEAFSAEAKAEREAERRTNILSDKDDEFLGCSKVGDSGASRSSNRWNRQPRMQKDADNSKPSLPELPARLILSQNERAIEVQCMFVEVKSQNDRLDGRQEDWLNILDRVGNARVCKFVNAQKPKKKGKPKAPSSS